ncbi:MAG: GGDEF domain-containing protein [Lachnospiraceae bacterium]|nr:GGDEF domain-containing protein [Lachnospiraceae bacterium]
MINSETMIITTEVVSVIFLAVILCGSLFGYYGRDKAAFFYRCCLITTIIGLLTDAFSYVIDGRVNETLLILINMVTYITWVLIVLFFALYTIAMIEKRVVVRKWTVVPVAVITGLLILACVVGSFNGALLYLEDGYFEEGPWGNAISIWLCVCTVYVYGVLFYYRKALERSALVAIAAFLFFPFLDTLVSLCLEIDYSYPILSVALMVVYVVVQEKTVSEDNIRKKIYEEDSYSDPVTRVKNRRAFDDIIKADVRGRAKGVACFKLQDLSDENAGRFAKLMREVFEGGDIFRISEDEFQVFTYKTGREYLEKKMHRMREILKEEGIESSFGYAYDEEAALSDMTERARAEV